MNPIHFVDIIGWAATLLTLLSFMFSKMTTLRLINFIGCAFWVGYGFLLKSNQVIATNVVIATIHVIWYIKLKRQQAASV